MMGSMGDESTASPELRVQMTKRTDGVVALRCIRRDGSVTWERHEKHAAFYSHHDLLHFAVETVLDVRSGFYGLIADGWEIADTTGKGPRGKPPSAAMLAEHVVGLLDRERSGGAAPLSAEEFNEQIESMLGPDPNRSLFTDAQLISVRNRAQELHAQWAKVLPGSTLELIFIRPGRSTEPSK